MHSNRPSVAPESPRAQSPVPEGPIGDLESYLDGLSTALYNLGTTAVFDSTKEKSKVGPSGDVLAAKKPVGQKVNDVVNYLARIEAASALVNTMVPMQVLQCVYRFDALFLSQERPPCLRDIDNGRNPMVLTKDRLERAATENQFMNGKIHAIEVLIF